MPPEAPDGSVPAGPPWAQQPWTQPPWVDVPRGRHSTGVVAVAAVVAFLVGLVFGGGAVGSVWAVHRASATAGPAAAEAAEQAAAGPTIEERLVEELPRLIEFVEEERGLSFLDEVDPELLDDAAFERALFAPTPGLAWDYGNYGATYVALGLTSNADRYYAAEAGGVDGLAGFYSYVSGRLLVRGTEWTPAVEATLVHELTHALQDQHFDLLALRKASDGDDDAVFAMNALVEGDAMRVQGTYIDRQSASWQDEYYSTWDDFAYSGPYDPLAEVLGWLPYWFGELTVDHLYGRSGNPTVNTAFRRLPASSAQLIDSDGWLRDLAIGPPVKVDTPEVPREHRRPGTAVVDEGRLGAVFLSLLPVDLEYDYFPEEFLAGWRGDAYVTWQDAEQTCTIVTVVLLEASIEDALRILEPWVERTGGEINEHDEGIELTACA